jgi:hypothetical protein
MTLGVYGLLAAKRQEVNAERERAVSLQEAWLSLVNLEQAIGSDIVEGQK